jgi:phosphoglycolate phosphatase-like HAD superfamily hydrolase
MLGPAPVVDFDGTLARLDVAWDELRATLRVRTIGELWSRQDARAWSAVTAAELEAAASASPVDPVLRLLDQSEQVAILTSNSERAVRAFLDHHRELAAKVVLVVGRETLGGPKQDRDVFGRGYERCVEATARARDDGQVVYVGDDAYEIEFARERGVTAYHVAELEGTR